MSGLTHITLSGTARERGQTHGQQLAEDIRHNIEFYLSYFETNDISESEAREYANRALERAHETHPNFATEIRGVAEGSGCPIEDVALINFRHTILYSAYSTQVDPDGCTSFGLDPAVSKTGHTYLGQNWDWKAGVRPALTTVRQTDHPDFFSLTEAGLVGGKLGCNDAGVGFCVNGLTTPEDGANPDRTPSHIRGWEILRSERLDQAIDAIIGTPRPTSRNYLVGRASGEILSIETTPTNSYFVYPTDGVLLHTNHFQTQTDVKSTLERQAPHSVSRLARIQRLFEHADRPISGDTVLDILQDHVGEPKSICRHAGSDDPEESMTNASLIMDLSNQRVLVAQGPPCEHSYHEHQL